MFKAIADGIYAAKVVKNISKELGVPISRIPQWVKDASYEMSSIARSNGINTKECARIVVEKFDNEILNDTHR